MSPSTARPRLIAHRGYSQRYPENTLLALEAALDVGADYIEFDVQFTADQVPVVFHDSELARLTGSEGIIQETPFAALGQLRVSEVDRLGEACAPQPIPSLTAVLALLQRWPQATAFVEIKSETLRHFGVEPVVEILLAALQPVRSQCCLISFDETVLARARQVGQSRIGWVIRDWNSVSQQLALGLAPDMLFCNAQKIGVEALWPGPWQWALYDIVDPEEALRWFARGADFIETWDIGGLLQDPRLGVERADD